ncbi:MAG: ACP S-malonyltransferase [Myxococcota bacterium]
MTSFLFPGQGSQAPGMGRALAETFPVARETFEEADEALGFELSKLCFEGPEDELKRTEITQPAILTTSVATLRALASARPDLRPRYVAGHSLGEWSALVAAGALTFPDAVRLVRERGRLMQAAVPLGEGAMLAVLGLTAEVVTAVCAEVSQTSGVVFAPANFNSPEQIVVSGSAAAAELAQTKLTEAGAKRIVPLPVSAPFHSPLMAPAAEGLREALADVAVSEPAVPVITNVEAAPNSDAARVKALLVDQVTAPVRWVESVQALVATGETSAFEIGPGKVLMGLARRIDRKLKVTPIEDPAGLEKAIALL